MWCVSVLLTRYRTPFHSVVLSVFGSNCRAFFFLLCRCATISFRSANLRCAKKIKLKKQNEQRCAYTRCAWCMFVAYEHIRRHNFYTFQNEIYNVCVCVCASVERRGIQLSTHTYPYTHTHPISIIVSILTMRSQDVYVLARYFSFGFEAMTSSCFITI